MNEHWIDLSTKNFLSKFYSDKVIHHPLAVSQHFFSYLFSCFEWQIRSLISYQTFGQNIYKIFLIGKCSHWRKVFEFQVRHSNKGPTLTADKNWTSFFYTSDWKYKRAYKNLKRRASKQSKSLINRSNYSPNLEILYKNHF